MNTDETKNIYFINVAKTVAIFLVVLAHLPIPNLLHAFINSFHMPLFFIITGYLIFTDATPFRKLLIKKIRTLLIPYYLFAILSWLYWYFIGNEQGVETGSGDKVISYITGALLAIPDKEYLGFNFPLWFLPSLFCAEILFYWIKKWFNKYSFIPVLILFGLGVLLNESRSPRLPLGIDVSFFALLFIQIGQWLQNKSIQNNCLHTLSFSRKILLSGILLCITIYIAQINQDIRVISMAKRIFNNYFLFLTGAVSGSLCILYLSLCFCKMRLFDFYGRNTIFILGLHLVTLGLIKGIQVYGFHIPLSLTEQQFGISVLYTLLVFVLLIPVIYIVNKYIPFLIGRKEGIL
ncbi:MAG: acyltransferase family protein [Dysgonamonadaceae bacterium]|jgi:fucose 4-O-acetylase-like acetyltransferase|nr:acyltransferase family protein [Dysgonamonadaceae bacterium]